MPGLLPPQARCTAYWYTQHAGLLTGSGDLEFLKCLGLRAWSLARWHGVLEWPKVQEGPYWVLMWPETLWDVAARQMAEDAARFGDWAMTDEAAAQPWQRPGDPGRMSADGDPEGYGDPGYWEAGDYG